MADKPDGGPAFPVDGYVSRADEAGYGRMVKERTGGMTLRDYLAAKAMQGILTQPDCVRAAVQNIAMWAYDQADAMLEERAK